VATNRAAIVFNNVVPQSVREAAAAYLKRAKEQTNLPEDHSFLSKYSPKIAAVVSLAQTDMHDVCVRLYDPIKKKWEAQSNFDFGRSLVSRLSNVPTLDVAKVYGFFQGLLNVQHILKLREIADKAVASVRSAGRRVGQQDDGAEPVNSTQKSGGDERNDQDATLTAVPFDAMAKRVYTNLRNIGESVDFRTFLSTLQTQFEAVTGQEWKSTLLKATRRMFSQLDADNILETGVEDTEEEHVPDDMSSNTCKANQAQKADEQDSIAAIDESENHPQKGEVGMKKKAD